MITTKQIENRIKLLCDLTGEFNNPTEAKEAGKKYFVSYESTPLYGGCRLIGIQIEGGGHMNIFGQSSACARVKKGEFYTMLSAMIDLIYWQQSKVSA